MNFGFIFKINTPETNHSKLNMATNNRKDTKISTHLLHKGTTINEKEL
jgi:hypothetical protein